MSEEDKMYSYLFIAWFFALFATLLSLYSSEVLKMSVCTLCWYQRVCLYPLVWILGVACFRGDGCIIPSVIWSPILAAVFGMYQYLEQMIPGFAPIKLCSAGADCSVIHIQVFGFITFPLLTVIIGVLITASLLLAKHYYSNLV
jgi:disulfide bond formation protein DsbB